MDRSISGRIDYMMCMHMVEGRSTEICMRERVRRISCRSHGEPPSQISNVTNDVVHQSDGRWRLGAWISRGWNLCTAIGARGLQGRVLYREAQARSIQRVTDNLSPAQRVQYEQLGYFEVIGGTTGTRYRIRRDYQMNVEQLDAKGKRARMLCFMPEGQLAVGDIMLAQKLALELFEHEAINVANEIPVEYCLIA